MLPNNKDVTNTILQKKLEQCLMCWPRSCHGQSLKNLGYRSLENKCGSEAGLKFLSDRLVISVYNEQLPFN